MRLSPLRACSIAPRPLLMLLGALALGPAAAAPQAPPSTRPPFERAQAAFMSHDLAAAELAYREVLKADTLSAHRREAATTLAAIAWRVREDTAAAQRVLAEAAATSWGRFDALIERARMLREWKDYRGAREAATQARAAASTDAERDDATTSWAAATLAPLLSERLHDMEVRHGDTDALVSDSTLLPEVVSRLDSIVRHSPGQLEPARLLILAAALADDAPALFDGWRSYYLIETGDTLQPLLAGPRSTLRAAAVSRVSGPGAVGRQRATIAPALRDSRLFSAAAVVALAPGSDGTTLAARDRQARETVTYAAFIDSVRSLTDRYYRATALGKGNPDAWKAALDTTARRLWQQLIWPGRPPAFTQKKFVAELDRRLGAQINLGETAGYQDLHMGHRVLDEQRTVQQYGHTGRVRFVALDAMVSNGFQSWAWDGQAEHGGWATKEMIVQVRPSYASAPIRAWRETTDSGAVRRLAEEVAADSVADLARARETPVAYFPSVIERLTRDGRHALLDSLRRAGLSGVALEADFKREVGKALVESSIFAHEGRHAIDNGLGVQLSLMLRRVWRVATRFLLAGRGHEAPGLPLEGPADLEYRAKLSEVAFAPRPRLALGGIISANAGDETPHGKANLRLLEGLHGWMREHAAEIGGLHESAPLLPQLPLLTDAQLKAAFASLDPFARESGVRAAAAAPSSRASAESRPRVGSRPPKPR